MWRQLGEIADVSSGYPFRGRVRHDPVGDIAVVQMKDVDELAGLQPDQCIRIPAEDGKFERYLLQQGDVLLQSRGHKFPATFVDKPVRGIAALGLHVLRPGAAVNPAYLAWVLNHPNVREALRGIAKGTYIPFLSKADLTALRVPVPSPAVQGRIVEAARLRAREWRLMHQLTELTDQLTNQATWQAATSKR